MTNEEEKEVLAKEALKEQAKRTVARSMGSGRALGCLPTVVGFILFWTWLRAPWTFWMELIERWMAIFEALAGVAQ